MPHTRIPIDELKVFESLTNVKVVFDIGARDDVDYLILKPGIELHAFEPNNDWFTELTENVGKTKKVYLNNWAAGSVEGFFEYNKNGECMAKELKEGDMIGDGMQKVQVRRLDNYIREKGIKRIDFLKMDVEGYEQQVIEGLGDKLKICRYVQYEQGASSSKTGFQRFLPETDFDLYYTGYRNVLGVRKGERLPYIPEEPLEGGQPEKDSSNYLAS